MDCRIWKSPRSPVAGTDPGPSGGGHGSSSIRPRANVSLMGMVNGKADLNTDVPFTLDGGTGRIDFIRCKGLAASLRYWRLKFFRRNYLGLYSCLETVVHCWRLKSARRAFFMEVILLKKIIYL